MTVKDKVGRRRYVVFKVSQGSAEKPRREVEKYLNSLRKDVRSLQLIQFKGSFGIVRVLHFELEKAIQFLNSKNNLVIETIITAGTLKKAREIIKKRSVNANMRN